MTFRCPEPASISDAAMAQRCVSRARTGDGAVSVVHTLTRTRWFLDDWADMFTHMYQDDDSDEAKSCRVQIAEARALSAELRKILASVGDCEIAIIPIAVARPKP